MQNESLFNEEMFYTFEVTENEAGRRLDSITEPFSACSGITFSRSQVQKMISLSLVNVNGKPKAKSYILKENDIVDFSPPEITEYCAEAEDIPLDIIFEDDDIIIINKPQGMVVHPSAGHSSGTLVNAVLFHCRESLSGIGGVLRPGIVHRIDKDTSGLICIAKNDSSHIALQSQLRDHTMHREYTAIVKGNLREAEGTVDAPIGRHKTDRKKMAVSEGGRNAVTHYKAEKTFTDNYSETFTLAKMVLETGRTHQIRVHMAYIGHPVLGDPIYGGTSVFEKHHPSLFRGQFLHASKLILIHPGTGEKMTFSCPLPENFLSVIDLLEK